jgi:hypothetical protein
MNCGNEMNGIQNHLTSSHTVSILRSTVSRGGACAGQNLRCAAATLASHVACSQHASRTEKQDAMLAGKESRTSQLQSSESVRNAAEQQLQQQSSSERLLRIACEQRAQSCDAMPQIMRKGRSYFLTRINATLAT